MNRGAHLQHVWAAWGKLDGGPFPPGDECRTVIEFPKPENGYGMLVWRFEIVARPIGAETLDPDIMQQWYRDALGIIWSVHTTVDRIPASGTIAWPAGAVRVDLARPLSAHPERAPYVTALLPPRWTGRAVGWQIGCALMGQWVRAAPCGVPASSAS